MGLNKKIMKGYFEITNSAFLAESSETLHSNGQPLELEVNYDEESKKNRFLSFFREV